MKLRKIIVFALLCLPVWPASAAAIAKLHHFVTATHSAQADFKQDVLDRKGKRLQSSSGTMRFERPGKFRWEYHQPYEQLILGDGKKFWMYDADLNQVTVKKLDAALGSSPAALLSGDNEIERNFTLKEMGRHGAVEWLQATPKSGESSFSRILMGFGDAGQLIVMELHDAFGHRTVLQFSAMKNNPKLSASLFQFTPPPGADVLGE